MSENTTTTTTTTDAKAPKAKDFKAYAKKAPTSLHQHYAEWLTGKTGMAVDGESAVKIVQLAVSLYHDYQASDENKARRAAEQAEREANAKPGKSPEAIQAQIEKLQAQLAKANATPANGAQSATATGQASKAPVGRRTTVKK